MGQARVRRRVFKADTKRVRAMRACAAHLRDLRRVHDAPPRDVEQPRASVPTRLSGAPIGSFCTSASELCAEIAP